MGCRDLTDGLWVWPEGLWHYVVMHGIARADDLLEHARRSRFIIEGGRKSTMQDLRAGAVVEIDVEQWETWSLERIARRS